MRPWELPRNLGRPDVQNDKTNGDMYTGSCLDQSQTGDTRTPSQDWPAAAFEMPVAPQQAVPRQEHLPLMG